MALPIHDRLFADFDVHTYVREFIPQTTALRRVRDAIVSDRIEEAGARLREFAQSQGGGLPVVALPYWIELLVRSGDRLQAVEVLKRLAVSPAGSTRMSLLACRTLRSLQEAPPPELTTVPLGVLTEVGIELGTELVAAYRDEYAVYITAQGPVAEADDATIGASLEKILASAAERLPELEHQPDGRRPRTLLAGRVRFHILTGAGRYSTEEEIPRGGNLSAGATAMYDLFNHVQELMLQLRERL